LFYHLVKKQRYIHILIWDEIFFVIKGVGKVLHNDKAVEFIEGSTFIVRTGEAHVLKNSGDQELILLGFGIEE